MRSVNPATLEIVAEHEEHSGDEVERRLVQAVRAFAEWRERPVADRAAPMRRLSDLLRAKKTEHAELMTREMGKPIAAAEAEVEKCALVCAHYAEHAPAWLAPEPVASDAGRSYVRFDPLGPVLAIMPWNFPYWQVFRFAAPAIMAGNVCALKHAPNVVGCGLAIERAFLEAGFPPGTMTLLVLSEERTGAVIDDDRIAAVTLTGSERAGRAVAGRAGARVKKTVLELGGSDPFVVLEDANLEDAVRTAVISRMLNNGQSCIAAKRFVVARRVADRFEELLVERMSRLVVGDPADRTVEVGPLARRDLLDNLHRQVEQSVEKGAKRLLGGSPLDRPGFFYPPTVVTDAAPGMPVMDEETFGPVAAVARVGTVEEAVDLANRTRYGLGASIWSADARAAERLAARIEAGCVFINGLVKSDPRLPFGGIRASGYGRELGREGLRELVNVKTVWVA